MILSNHIPIDAQDNVWDVVVIGTGAGGGTAGFNLARLGHSVLFIERGNLSYDPATGTLLSSAGTVRSDSNSYHATAETVQAGDSPVVIGGSAVGGSTSLFAMVMDRFRPVDLQMGETSHSPPSSSLPLSWPIEYQELSPFYREAEALYRVRGTDDPLTPTGDTLLDPLPPSSTETVIDDILTSGGLHPYRLHYAREYVPGCDGCLMHPCPRNCRNDAGRVCVLPALEHHNAHILPDCHAMKLEMQHRTVQRVICRQNGRLISIRGRTFVLALGALGTPALLLRSATDSSPDGLGNESGMLGRNLMMHVSDIMVVKFATGGGGLLNRSLHNGISINDFYVHHGVKLGNIHAHAMDLDSFKSWLRVPIDESSGALIFATIVEDFPYVQNRVVLQPGSDSELTWEYNYPDELWLRSRLLTTAFADRLIGMCDVVIHEPSGGLNSGHACGTCRFGNDRRSSVLDRDNKVHDLDNVYVLDASFFPSSGGINPSLTIAANSLRVSNLIAKR